MLADRRRLRHGHEHGVGEVGGIGRGEPQSLNSFDRTHRAQQRGKIMLTVVIAVDRLPKERDLGGALLGQARHFADHVGQLAAPLRSARHRNDAERAPIIAAPLHGHEGGHLAAADGRDVLVMLPALECDVGSALAIAGPRDQLGETAVAVGSDHEVHLRHALEQRGTEPLRHAADHAEHVTGALVALQLPQPTEDTLLRVIPHSARIDEHHVRIDRIVRAYVALAPQNSQHQLGVGDVHLAAVGLDIDARHQSISTANLLCPAQSSERMWTGR